MRTASEINDQISDMREELDAIVAVAEREERDLNAEESARVTELADTIIPDLQAKMKTALKIDRERKERAATRFTETLAAQSAEASATTSRENGHTPNRFASLRIPAKAKAHRPLKAYTGQDAERDAYIAGNVMLAALYGTPSATAFCRNHGLEVQAAMNTGTNSGGGFLVPDEMQQTLIRLREERGVFPRFANNVPMGADIIRIPRLLTDVTVQWVAEAGEATASDPVLGEAELMARKLMAITKISSELDEDAVIDIGEMLTTSMAYGMADKIDDAGFNGDGTSTYGGVLGLKNCLDANAIQDAISGNVGASTLDLEDFEYTLAKYPQYTGANPRWFMHSAVFYAGPYRLMNAAGGNTNVTLSSGVMTPMFLGYPVEFVQVMPSTTGSSVSTILAYFGDLRLSSSYGTRRAFRTQVSAERYFETDQIGIKSTERIAINNHERGDTIRNRPIVALKTAS